MMGWPILLPSPSVRCVGERERGGERTEIEWSNKEDVNAVYRSNLINNFKRLLCLNLNHGDKSVVRLLKILGKAGVRVEALHRYR